MGLKMQLAAAFALVALAAVAFADDQPHVVGDKWPDRPNQAANQRDTNEFRKDSAFPRYVPLLSNPVTVDTNDWRWNGAFIFFLTMFFVIWPGTHAFPSHGSHKFKYESLGLFLFSLWMLYTGWVIFAANWQHYWMAGSVDVHTLYAPYSPSVIDAKVGVKVGLRGFNITLEGKPIYQNITATGTSGAFLTRLERIDYNEYISWAQLGQESLTGKWRQGRFGFGQYGGNVAQTWHRWQRRGVPIPITVVAELLVLDGEAVRWCRWFRIAGWYTHIMMYTCVPIYFFMIFYYFFAPWWGALLHVLLSLCLAISCILYHNITALQLEGNLQFQVPYEDINPPHETVFLRPVYSWTLHLVACTGGLNLFLALVTMGAFNLGILDTIYAQLGTYEHPSETDFEGEHDEHKEEDRKPASAWGVFMAALNGSRLKARGMKSAKKSKAATTEVSTTAHVLNDRSETPFGEPILDGDKAAQHWLHQDAQPGQFVVVNDGGDLKLLVNAVVKRKGREDTCVARQFPIFHDLGLYNFHSAADMTTAKNTIEAAINEFIADHQQFNISGPWRAPKSAAADSAPVVGAAASARTAEIAGGSTPSKGGDALNASRFSLV